MNFSAANPSTLSKASPAEAAVVSREATIDLQRGQVRVVHGRLGAMMARGWAGLDWSALGLLAALDAGPGAPNTPSPRQS